jgi:hypothetical protein
MGPELSESHSWAEGRWKEGEMVEKIFRDHWWRLEPIFVTKLLFQPIIG